ncbi:MAG TPA: small ribosomal subunit biogenesis GTPase RsgA [Oscillatoriaceae cyanobacterium M33_DOE_052]|uniref:Small ribosomal subunit biogenesis GTPase RsgA n=1 Tax=Planktothricoides sp. SpSt-374 TaxID=2282167 RepID=A0A7C3VPH4_9CYAN|nr:small ribosomal subunit biogenesis GTPase RsgA [Oscillatoriaceae cyanobacterium M33_DOE_052]
MILTVANLPDSHEAPLLTGTVLAVQANYYRVELDPPMQMVADQNLPSPLPQFLLCTRRSRLKKIGQQVMVGDRVAIDEPDFVGQRGAISSVFPRQSELDRPPIANADRILLVFALEEPTLDPHQLTRFLVKAESTGLQVSLCLNKSDLLPPPERQQWQQRLQNWGYQPLFISVQQDEGLPELKTELANQITVICGPSGVGKSSLINHLIPEAHLRVAAVSGKLGRGRHTTRHVELFKLPGGGLLADTPGFNQPELNSTPTQLANYFPEARLRLGVNSCQFANCLHGDEPNCAVSGDWERYGDYLELLHEAIEHQEFLHHHSDRESSLKVKTKRSGKPEYEPRLESKKYRRISRRFQHQQLHDLESDELEEEP